MNFVSQNLDVGRLSTVDQRACPDGMPIAHSGRMNLAPAPVTSASLILHDDEPTLAHLRSLLNSAGYETASAPTAYKLLSIDFSEPPQLVLLGMTSLDDRDVEVVTVLRKRWPDAWILALYPATLRERAAHALALGADASLPEPFYAGEILAIARRVSVQSAIHARTPVITPHTTEDVGHPASFEHLAAGVAHMVRNPLQIVELQLDTAEVDKKLDIGGIREQIARIEGVVDELTRFAGRSDTGSEPVDVSALVERVFAKTKKKAAGPTFSVRSETEKAEVVGSPDLLRGVFETLRQRAERTTPQSGRVEIRARLRAEGARRVVEVLVTDGGPRMTDVARARMFEPFPDAASLQEGTGLELAASAGVVRAHGGSMASLPAGEVGTTIVVRLPLRDSNTHAAKAGVR